MRNFWVPLHKLFDGDECLRGKRLSVRLSANHVNEELRRAHLRFLAGGHHSGWVEPDLSEPPFVIRDGIAEFYERALTTEAGLLTPVAHQRLIERATYRNEPLTYLVPKSKAEIARCCGEPIARA